MCFGIILSQGLGDLISLGLYLSEPLPPPQMLFLILPLSQGLSLAYSVFGGPPPCLCACVCVFMCLCICLDFLSLHFLFSQSSLPSPPPPLVFLLECRALSLLWLSFFLSLPTSLFLSQSLPELVGLYLFLLISFLIPLWSLLVSSLICLLIYISFILFR